MLNVFKIYICEYNTERILENFPHNIFLEKLHHYSKAVVFQ